MKLWPFGRNKEEQSDLPKEVQDYYQAEKREKVGVAGLLALGTLVVTILLAIGLFFGGRWIYRTVFDNDRDQQVAQNEGEQREEERNEQEQNEQEQNPNETEEEPAPAPAPTAPQNNPAPAPSAPAPASPAPAPSRSSDLPSTGPADNLAIFLGTVIVASGAFYLVRQPEQE